MIAWGRPLLVSFYGAVLMQYWFSPAAAEADAAVAEVEMAAEAEEGKSEFTNQAEELKDKLAMLSQLIEAKGGGQDPSMIKKLDGLQEQLGKLGKSLGLDDLPVPPKATEELEQIVAGCLVMALQNVGPRKPTATGALRRLAGAGFTQKDAKDMELIRLVGICLSDMSDAEYELYKSKKISKLPNAMVSKAKTSAGSDVVAAIDDEIWAVLQKMAREWVNQFGGDFGAEDSSSAAAKPQVNAAASNLGLLAFIPILGIAGFLTKKFLDQQKEVASKKESKKAKKQK